MIQFLPKDIQKLIANELDVNSFNNLMATSRYFNSLFGDTWKEKLAKLLSGDFYKFSPTQIAEAFRDYEKHISKDESNGNLPMFFTPLTHSSLTNETLDEEINPPTFLAEFIQNAKTDAVSDSIPSTDVETVKKPLTKYCEIYHRVLKLAPYWAETKPKQLDKSFYLLLVCRDEPSADIDYLALTDSWMNVAIYAGCVKLFKEFIKTDFNFCLQLASLAGNLTLVKLAFDYANEQDHLIFEDTLNRAINSGSVKLVSYIVDAKHFKPTMEALRTALGQKNKPMLNYLLDESHGFNLHPQGKLKTDIEQLLSEDNSKAQSASPSMVRK